MADQLILVAIRGQHTKIVFGPAIPDLVNSKKSELTRSGNWKLWRFELRTEKGYAAKKILKQLNQA